MTTREFNFDGLVGPTHNYSGLALGNMASAANQANTSRPREAALQGLAKMKLLHDMGVCQGVIPPQERPCLQTLYHLGFRGSDHEIIEQAAKTAPRLLAACTSASSMWAANAATVSPSPDTEDDKVHFTPANLISHLHRSIEAGTTAQILKSLFNDPAHFNHHTPLPACDMLSDEGAANHIRLCADHGQPGLEVFVYGRSGFSEACSPQHFPARQTLEASQAIARHHQLNPQQTIFVSQNPEAIDNGVFHNDVISVGNRNILFYHEKAFVETRAVIEAIKIKAGHISLQTVCVPEREVSVADAVRSYLFNSQIVDLPGGEILLLLPTECEETESVNRFIETLPETTDAFSQIKYINLRQSMSNGGGPACLRLRVVLNDAQRTAMHQGVLFDDNLYSKLVTWVEKHYRETLAPEDIFDPGLLDESRSALDKLTQILDLGALYPFQN